MMTAEQMNPTQSRTGFELSLYEAARLCDAVLLGEDVLLHGVSTDSRSLQPGNLFIALRGEHFDGHEFVEQAIAAGAAAVMIDHNFDTVLPALRVKNTREAMGRLAAGWRQRFSLPVVAVTGSNGKTTVRSMLAAIFSQQQQVLATIGNLNNDIGLPLTMFRLSANDDVAVLEMGANHAGEIAWLTELATPQVAVVTNASAAHLEGFGSLEGVARAKGELFSGLPPQGVAVINADDMFAPLWRTLAGHRRVISFGLHTDAEVRAEWQAADTDTRMTLYAGDASIEINLPLPGRHNVMNALAASAAALSLDVPLQLIKTGLEALQAVPGRLQILPGQSASRLINDTYNANPASLDAALDVLALFAGRRVLVLGDMAELGEQAGLLHEDCGRLARRKGVDVLYAVGPLSVAAIAGFGDNARHFDTHETLIAVLRDELAADVTVLVKGSRRMHMETVVQALQAGEGSH